MKNKLPGGIYAVQFVFLMSFASLAVLSLLPLFFEHLGGSPGQIGFLVGIFSFAAFLARPFGGWLLNRADARKVLSISLFFQFAMTCLYFLITQLNWFLILIRIFHGISLSLFTLAALLITVNITPQRQRAYALGVVSSGFMIPLLFLPFLGEGIIIRFGYPMFFFLAAACAFIPFVFSLFVRFPPFASQEESPKKSQGLLKLLLQKKILVIVCLTLLFEIALSSALSFVPLLAHEGSAMLAGFFYSSLALLAVFLRLYAGKHLRFWGQPFFIIPAFAFLAAGAWILNFSRVNLHLVISGVIWGIGVGVLYPHLSAMVIEGVRLQERSRILGLFTASVDLGYALGPVLFGLMSNIFGIRRTFPVLAGILLALAFLLMGIGKKELFASKPGNLA